MFKDIFQKKQKKKYIVVPQNQEQTRKEIPDGIVIKCKKCQHILYTKDLEKNLKVCTQCQYHYPLSARERIGSLVDEGTFVEFDAEMTSSNPLSFPEYEEKIASDQKKTNLQDAIITGKGMIESYPVVIGVMDPSFRMGSMGSVVGEKITRAIEHSLKTKTPFLLFSASGGARMQEGVLSLMQMAKTSAALKKLDKAGLLFISIMTDPTTGGVSASFASLGDINMAEPGALIGFAGRRIIEQTIRQKLPDDFQTSEFLLEHGQLDQVVHRHELKKNLATILQLHQ